VDAVRAQADAQRVLNTIDWSKRDIVIWVPGTGQRGLDPRFADAVAASWSDGGVSLVALEYAAGRDLHGSVPTGIATLRLVLAAIAAHGGNHRVLVAGTGQGAWVASEALDDPAARAGVRRAVLFGVPAEARTHWTDGRDDGVVEIDDAYDAGTAAGAGNLLGSIFTALHHLPVVGDVARDATDYAGRYASSLEFLRFGPTGDATDIPPPAGSPAAAARRKRAVVAFTAA
jgi:hypothetical protein